MGITSLLYKQLERITTSDKFIRKKYKDLYPHVEVIKKQGITTVNLFGKSQTRGFSTAKMISDCLKHISGTKDFHFRFFINDKPKSQYEPNSFYYCVEGQQHSDQLIPDFAFDGWLEAGINNYGKTTESIELAGNNAWTDSRMFWIGNIKTNPVREKLLKIADSYPLVFCFKSTFVDQYIIDKKKVDYVSLPEHTKYKYLLDVEGNSYSARLKFLFFSKRVVFIQERSWKEFFHFYLEPYKHFIPVKNDLSDLYDQYMKLEKDPELYHKIVDNALSFAHQHLTYDAAIELMIKQINRKIDAL